MGLGTLAEDLGQILDPLRRGRLGTTPPILPGPAYSQPGSPQAAAPGQNPGTPQQVPLQPARPQLGTLPAPEPKNGTLGTLPAVAQNSGLTIGTAQQSPTPETAGRTPLGTMPSAQPASGGLGTMQEQTPDYVSQYRAIEAAQPVAPNPNDYKPSLKREILGTLAGAGIGFLGGGPAGAKVGEDIVNAPYNRAERNYETAENAYKQRLGTLNEEVNFAKAAHDLGKPETVESGGIAYQYDPSTQAFDKPIGSPQPKEGLTPEETTIHDLMTGDNGQPRVNPDTQKPYTYFDAYKAVQQAKQDTKPAPGVTSEQNKLQFQTAASKLAAEGLSTDPAQISQSIRKSQTLTPQEKDFMSGYLATNPNPATTLRVNVEGAGQRAAIQNAGKYYRYADDTGVHLVKGDQVPQGVDAVPVGGDKEVGSLINEARAGNIIQQSLNRVSQDVTQHPELFDNAAARNIMATTLEQIDRSSAGMLIAGTGGSIPLPSGLGDMINTALQNRALDQKTSQALKQYIADYKSMKDKVMTMQMEMQGGKIGRANAMAFKAIADQIPNGGTPDSKTAMRQIDNLQQAQTDLMKQYPDRYADFEKEKPFLVGGSSNGAPPPGARIRTYDQSTGRIQ